MRVDSATPIKNASMMSRFVTTLAALLALNSLVYATEPNETFSEATVLAPGVHTVADELTGSGGGSAPDTLLGIRDLFGDYYAVGDGSLGFGSVPTNYLGSIDFSITGAGDDTFAGFHNETGEYEVFVDVYDFGDELVDSFSEVRTLAPGVVHDFSYNDFEWANGSYDVYADSGGGAADVDYFTFTNLAPNSLFSIRTADPDGIGIDTYLGWFSSSGFLLEANDDEDFNSGIYTSLIEGNVPSDGTLTFAVTGYGDESFAGVHSQVGAYELRLEAQMAGLTGDYNRNGGVDAADYVLWRKTTGQTGSGLAADGNGDETVDELDYDLWREHFGATASASAATSTASAAEPEPAAGGMIAAVFLITFSRPRLKPSQSLLY